MDSINLDDKFTYDNKFKGPIKKRSCTDLVCLFIFAGFILGWLFVAFFAVRYGNPEQLIYPSDSYGRICGQDELTHKPYLYFFNILRCAKLETLNRGCETTQVCVSKCPNYTESYVKFRSRSEFQKLTKQQKTLMRQRLICTYEINPRTARDEEILRYLRNKKCGLVYFQSEPFAGRCIPIALQKFSTNTTDKLANLLDEDDKPVLLKDLVKAGKGLSNLINLKSRIENILQDLSKTWSIILWALVIAMVISFLWILLLQIIAGFMVWLSILAVLAILIMLSYLSGTQYMYLRNLPTEAADEDLNDHSLDIDATTIFTTNLNNYINNKTLWIGLAICLAFSTVILFLTFVFLRKRIKIAISLIEEASKAINSAKSSLLFPIVPYIFQILVIGVSAFIALLIAASKRKTYRISQSSDPNQNGLPCNPFNYVSRGTNSSICTPYQYFSDDILNYAHVYNLFVGLWVLFFIKGMCQLIFAGTFSAYYWAFEKPRDIPTFPLLKSIYRAFRYHMGSVAFGSLVLAIIRLFRLIVEYIYRKCQKYPNNALVKAVTCTFRCCFWMLEKFMIFLNTNAYIMISIHGKSFLTSARNAFSLLMRNVIRLAVVDKVADYILLVGKLVVTAIMGLLSYYYFTHQVTFIHFLPKVPDLNYFWSPVVFICIFTYLIASTFFNVYNMAVDTIFLCFLEDCERNDGSPSKPYYMSDKLMKILDYRNKS